MINTRLSDQHDIDKKNIAFWDELCGSQLARSLGIVDDSPASLKKFDDWYFDFYPYLFKHIPFPELKGKKVLEVGMGYGSVSQKLAEAGANYQGLDIAAGPVAMVNQRVKRSGFKGSALQGSILQPPFDNETFDWVVAIGCLHHTGDLIGAIAEVHRLLKTDGQAIIMIYNALSYRQWCLQPMRTLKQALGNPTIYSPNVSSSDEMRSIYDRDLKGNAAPQTEFVTKRQLKHICREFRTCTATLENIGAEGQLRFLRRDVACNILGPYLGLDIYCRLSK